MLNFYLDCKNIRIKMANVTVTKSTTAKLNHQTTLYQKLPCTKKYTESNTLLGCLLEKNI